MVLKAGLHFLNEICKKRQANVPLYIFIINIYTFERKIYKSAGVLYGTKYSRMDQVKFVEDNL